MRILTETTSKRQGKYYTADFEFAKDRAETEAAPENKSHGDFKQLQSDFRARAGIAGKVRFDR